MPKSICIAAGHGGFDSGAVGNRVEEKNINLSVSLALAKHLTDAGIHVVMTRTTDEAAGGAKDVPDDLANQCKIANDAKVDLFFTIHANAAAATSASGAEAYVMPGDAGAAQLAQKCVSALHGIVGTHGEPVKDGSRLYVIHNTSMPAVLVELGFVTNENDAKKMTDEPDAFAEALASVLIPYLGGSVKQAEPTPQPEPKPEQPASKDDDAQFVTHAELSAALDELKKELATPSAPSQPAAPAPTRKDLITLEADISSDALYFDLPVSVADLAVKSVGKMIWDTGAFEILIDKGIADSIGLPNLGETNINGVGGSVSAYNSEIKVKLGESEFVMPCVVDPSWNALSMGGGIGLFGLRGLIDNHINFEIDLDGPNSTGNITLFQKA